MKRSLITILLLGLLFCPKVLAEELPDDGQPYLPSIFIWQLTDQEDNTEDELAENEEEEEISLEEENLFLKGYLEYAQGADDIYLRDEHRELVLDLSVPQKFDKKKVLANRKLPTTTFAQKVYARSEDIAYNIAPLDRDAVFTRVGNFSMGTSYNESIDKSDLGFTTSFYTKYDQKYFSLSTSYNKESGVAYSAVVDKLSFAPEIKLNKYISIKDVITSDITRNRKQNSLILSVKPTKDERVRFEFGAGQTFDENKGLIKSEVKFSTRYDW